MLEENHIAGTQPDTMAVLVRVFRGLRQVPGHPSSCLTLSKPRRVLGAPGGGGGGGGSRCSAFLWCIQRAVITGVRFIGGIMDTTEIRLSCTQQPLSDRSPAVCGASCMYLFILFSRLL